MERLMFFCPPNPKYLPPPLQEIRLMQEAVLLLGLEQQQNLQCVIVCYSVKCKHAMPPLAARSAAHALAEPGSRDPGPVGWQARRCGAGRGHAGDRSRDRLCPRAVGEATCGRRGAERQKAPSCRPVRMAYKANLLVSAWDGAHSRPR